MDVEILDGHGSRFRILGSESFELNRGTLGARVSNLIEGLWSFELNRGTLCDLASLRRKRRSPRKGPHTLQHTLRLGRCLRAKLVSTSNVEERPLNPVTLSGGTDTDQCLRDSWEFLGLELSPGPGYYPTPKKRTLVPLGTSVACLFGLRSPCTQGYHPASIQRKRCFKGL